MPNVIIRPFSKAAIVGILSAVFIAVATERVAAAAHYPGLKPDEFMKTWLVLRAIPVSNDTSPDDAAQKKAFADDLLASAGGEPSVKPTSGLKSNIAGKVYEWRVIESKADIIDLNARGESNEFAIAYAWAEIEMPAASKALLGVGSDDGVKVWLNGRLVHENWIGRPARADDDVAPVEFIKGRNQLLMKIQNMQGPWGFACRLLGQEATASKLVTAARTGDLEGLKRLLEQGADIDSPNPAGLTAAQAARLRGQREIVEFLASKGADTKAAIPPPEKLVDALFNSAIKGATPGAVALVAQHGRILFEKGYGLANVEHRVPVTPETKFRIGSITKQFTAAAILKLQEAGKLSVNDTLAKFIPDYPRGGEVTIHHLLTHTSGIHSYTSKPDFLGTVMVGVKPDEHIKSFKNDPYDFDPGKKWLYNNSAYFLLGYIIEKVSGDSYGEYLRRTFFEPLGMKDSGVHDPNTILDHEAQGYQFEGGQFKKSLNWDMSRAGAAGALYSTVGDLYRWNEALFSGKVLNEASLKAAFTPVIVEGDDITKPKVTGYGYGWTIQQIRGLQEIAHGGGLHGFVSYLLRLPKENFTVSVLVNTAPSPPGVDSAGLAREVAELYLWEKLAPRETPKIDTRISSEAFGAIVGRYDYGGAILSVTKEGDKVFAQLTGQPKQEIFPKSATEYFWKVVEAEVTFEKNDKGNVIKAIHRQNGQTITAPRLEDVQVVKVDPKVYAAYAGKYDYGNGKAIMTMTCEGDRFFAQLTGQPKFEIYPKSETEFFWKVVNAQVTFVRDGQGKVTKVIHEQAGQKFDAPRID